MKDKLLLDKQSIDFFKQNIDDQKKLIDDLMKNNKLLLADQ